MCWLGLWEWAALFSLRKPSERPDNTKGLKGTRAKLSQLSKQSSIAGLSITVCLFRLSILNLYYFSNNRACVWRIKTISIYKFSSQTNKMFWTTSYNANTPVRLMANVLFDWQPHQTGSSREWSMGVSPYTHSQYRTLSFLYVHYTPRPLCSSKIK